MEYKVKLAQFRIPKYGLLQMHKIGVDSETVRLSGTRVQVLSAIMVFPIVSGLNNFAGVFLGVRVKTIPLVVLCSAVMLFLYYRWRHFLSGPVVVEKRLLTNIGRDRKEISFCLPNPEGPDQQPVKVSLKAKNEDEAIKLENELRS
jgi:hypothetical protein